MKTTKNITIVLMLSIVFFACKKDNTILLKTYPIYYDTIVMIPQDTMIIETNYYIPNAFSPNGDAENDLFRVRGSKNIRDFRLVIYNTEGIKLFETFDINTGWDGTNKKGYPQPIGTYSYLINGTFSNGDKYTFSGEVFLIH